MIKISLRILLAISFALPINAIAKPLSPQELIDLSHLASAYGSSKTSEASKERLKRLPSNNMAQASAGSRLSDTLGRQGQALVLMMIIAGVEVVHQEIKRAKLRNESVNYEQTFSLSGQAAEQILSGGGTWLSIAGAGVVTPFSKKPIVILETLLKDAGAHDILRSLLQSGICSLVAFGGWDLGGQLWDEARELITDDTDYTLAGHMGSVALGSLTDIFSNSGGNQNDVRVLKIMTANIARILFLDNDLRNLWLYNAWRLRIATGDFVTMVSSMVGAGAIGTAIFPGAGTLAGLCFGVAGGTLALFVPTPVKDEITDGLDVFRNTGPFLDMLAHAQNILAMGSFDIVSASLPNWLTPNQKSEIIKLKVHAALVSMRKERESIMTVQTESYMRQYSAFQVLQGNRSMAISAGNMRAAGNLGMALARRLANLQIQAKQFADTYQTFIDQMSRLMHELPAGETLRELKDDQLLMIAANKKILMLARAWSISQPAETLDSSSNLLLYKIYLTGFDEISFASESAPL